MTADRDEIANLIARYAELLNLGQIEEVGALFEHGRITSEGNPNTYEGREGVTKMYRDSLVLGERVPDTLIFTSNLQIHVEGEAATGKAYFMAMHEGPHGLGPVLAGRYHDRYRRIDGTWWFEHRHMFPDLQGDLTTHLTKSIEAFNEPDEG
jgi:hypothetical protein